jgi:hypothetical protein
MKFAFALAVLFSACGNGAMGQGYGPPYATLHGRITSATAAITSPDVRVALVWERLSPLPGTSVLKVAQELGVRAQFPVDFQIDVAQLPPEDAMNQVPPDKAAQAGIDPSMRFALGTILVYEDTNGNGTLDLVPLGSEPTDHVLGVPEDVAVFYIEGPPPPSSAFMGFSLQRGFNLLRQPVLTLPTGCEQPTETGSFSLLPLSTTIEIELTNQPELARFLCAADPAMGASGGTSMCIGGPCPLDLPPVGANVCCSTDGLSYQYRACPASSLCESAFCHYGSGQRVAGQPIPQGWPCN